MRFPRSKTWRFYFGQLAVAVIICALSEMDGGSVWWAGDFLLWALVGIPLLVGGLALRNQLVHEWHTHPKAPQVAVWIMILQVLFTVVCWIITDGQWWVRVFSVWAILGYPLA